MLKMAINFSYPADSSITLDNIDFFVEFYTNSSKKVKLQKEELVYEELDGIVNCYALVDTNLTGSGRLKMRLMAYIPDTDSPDGIRPEYEEVETNVLIG